MRLTWLQLLRRVVLVLLVLDIKLAQIRDASLWSGWDCGLRDPSIP
jgi:hypothetical protein